MFTMVIRPRKRCHLKRLRLSFENRATNVHAFAYKPEVNPGAFDLSFA